MNIPKLTSYLRQLSISGDLNQAELVRTVIETAPQSNYQSYRIKITPTTGANPTITVFDNTLPGTLTWFTPNVNTGEFYLSSSAFNFTEQNTFIQIDRGGFTSVQVSGPPIDPGAITYSTIVAFAVTGGEYTGRLRLNYYYASLDLPVYLELKVYL